ncbi:MAG: pitrilysin family protein [Anaerolineae bacterium]
MPVQETIFDNGLKVLTVEMHNAPVATFWVWYRVGSRNESLGITGASHWVEHMMFKGTGRLKKGDIFKLISQNGGVNNAFTWMDYTAYFETLPSDRLDLAIQIESDRMVNSAFDPEEVDSERTVIISEREGHENDPEFWLAEEVQATAFKVHPYHHDTIGWKADLLRMTRDDLYNHYRKYYVPNNAIAIAVGDFDTPVLLDKLRGSFGKISRGADIPPLQVEEPAQEGERRVVVRRPGANAYFLAAFHAPQATDPDFFACFMLAGVLSGSPSLAAGGRASPGRSSRLYRALVEKELAASVYASYHPMLDPYLFEVEATVRHGVSIERVERAILAELERIAAQPISDNEYHKVLKQTRAQYVYAEDGVSNHGYRLGMLDMVASYHMYDTFLENLEKVTKADIQRVAAQYLSERNRTIGWFIPAEEPVIGRATRGAAKRHNGRKK